jgi:putative two-component system hydrogenase maturation factor HypX/HoxX
LLKQDQRPAGPRYRRLLAQKQAARQRDEQLKPLADYRREELKQMSANFWDDDGGYHVARAAFVRKEPRDSARVIAPDIASDRGAHRRDLAVVSS